LRGYDQPKSVNIVVDSKYFREKPEGLNIHWKPQFEICNFLCIGHTHADFGRNALRQDISAISQDGSLLSRDITNRSHLTWELTNSICRRRGSEKVANHGKSLIVVTFSWRTLASLDEDHPKD
jgi:hypothetical protein